MAAPRIPNMIDCGQCSLHLVSQTNVWFIEELFRYEDINKYYVVNKEKMQILKSINIDLLSYEGSSKIFL